MTTTLFFYHLTTFAFITCVVWSLYFSQSRVGFFLLVGALICLWIRVTLLVPAYLEVIKKTAPFNVPEIQELVSNLQNAKRNGHSRRAEVIRKTLARHKVTLDESEEGIRWTVDPTHLT